LVTLETIAKEVSRLAAKIGAPAHFLPMFGISEDFARPHIEVDASGLMHYVIVERGSEISRKSTENLDELLQMIFGDVSFSMACKLEQNNRVSDQDFRRVLFQEQTKILRTLSEKWFLDNEIRIKEILTQFPYDDLSDKRLAYWKELRHAGLSEADIAQRAYEKYPAAVPDKE
jgi:hypothetical protein